MPDMPLNINSISELYPLILPWALKLLYAGLIFFIGRAVSNILVKILGGVLKRAKLDQVLVNFCCSIASALLLLIIIIAALEQLGVNTTSLVALIGAAGLAIGLSLQNSLQNFASGVLLVVFRPFSAGNFVEAGGVSGIVEKINIFTTTMRTPDNREVIVPNSAIYGGNIINYSAKDKRRIDLVFGIGYDDDLKLAKETILEICAAEERVLEDPETVVIVSELADSSVNLTLRAWVNTDDFGGTKADILERVKLTFDEKNISIPYPQMDVRVSNS